MRHITRTVWILSLVSLFTDMASEMLYPIMPLYLKSIGFSILFIGVLEGMAEATAGLSKGYFGKLSDNSGQRLPFVQIGYGLSAISKPLMVFFVFPFWIFFVRTLDRLGKGIRTGARDAILSTESAPATRARIFGFHRSMDTLGAVLGPLAALAYLYFYPGHYITLFYFAFIPGLFAVIASLLIPRQPVVKKIKKRTSFFSFMQYWKTSPAAYRKLCAGLLLFTLFNSSDVFLLLKVKQSGLDDSRLIGIYIFYNLVYAISSFPLGILADKIGLKKVFIGGLFIFSIVYLGMSKAGNIYSFLSLFLLYGIYAAATDGVSKAWITRITDKQDTATAIGSFAAFQSICTMLASSIAGLIWYKAGAFATFLLSGVGVLGVIVYMALTSTDGDTVITENKKGR